MTTEEKAKAYDIALEGARKELGVDRKEWEVVQRVLHNIFPELTESEDERTRKEIISALKFANDGGVYDKHIAYLEKQKEQKPTWQEVKGRRGRIGDTPEHIRKKAENFLSKMEPPYDADDICSAYETGAMENAKPAEWSEEDEEMLDAMVDIVSNSLYEPLCPREGMLAWLKSLRPSWKPSEEQMKALEGASTNKYLPARQLDILVSLYEHLKKL